MQTRSAVILAHGQPSDPAPAEAELAALAAKVAAFLPGWQVGSATLAEPGALGKAVAGQSSGLAYPLFMAGGWFTKVQIPARLVEAGATGWQVLEPFGCDPAVHDLCITLAGEAGIGEAGIGEAGIGEAGAEELILAAHGSSKSQVPSDIARHVAGRIAAETAVARVATGFVDQVPQLSTLTGFGHRSVCLPFFAASGGHVTEDLPQALLATGFTGRILPPVGCDARVPALIAAAILRGQPVCTEACRWAKPARV